MERKTLNILLSFAQFEREIIGERTRDKLSAARRKGKWIGGIPVLGYDVAPEGGTGKVEEQQPPTHIVWEINEYQPPRSPEHQQWVDETLARRWRHPGRGGALGRGPRLCRGRRRRGPPPRRY